MQVLGRCAHTPASYFARQQRERPGVTINRFDQIGDLSRIAARIVGFGSQTFLRHDLADQFDGVFTAQRAERDLTMAIIKRRRQRLAGGEEQARRGIGEEQVAAKIEDFGDGRIGCIAAFGDGVQASAGSGSASETFRLKPVL
jgi:hypothetical protein